MMWGYIDFVEVKRKQLKLSRTELLTEKYSIIVNHTDFIGVVGMYIRDLERFVETYEYFNPSADAQYLPIAKDFSGMTRAEIDQWTTKILNLT